MAKTICRYAQERGHAYLRLEKNGRSLLCTCGHGQDAEYLKLDSKTETSVIETFRRLVGASENDLFADKRFKIKDKNRIIKGRATLIPDADGEKLLITLSAHAPTARRLSALGLNRQQQNLLRQNTKKKHGLIIIAAPEENGATSTYYSILAAIANNRSTYSLETHPASHIDNINTIDLNKSSDINETLIRLSNLDSEIIGLDANLSPAEIKGAWQAAKGRLIVMTLNATNAGEVVKIMRRAGLKPEEIAARTLLIVCQKLFNKPCGHCLRKFDVSETTKKIITQRWPIAQRLWPRRLYHNLSCSRCRQPKKEYKTAIFELMHFWPDGRLCADYQPLIKEALSKAELGLINIEDIADWAQNDKKV